MKYEAKIKSFLLNGVKVNTMPKTQEPTPYDKTNVVSLSNPLFKFDKEDMHKKLSKAIDAHHKTVMKDLHNQEDNLIREAINYKVGHNKWTLEDIKDRGYIETTYDNSIKERHFIFDEEELLIIYDYRYDTIKNVFEIPYKKLY